MHLSLPAEHVHDAGLCMTVCALSVYKRPMLSRLCLLNCHDSCSTVQGGDCSNRVSVMLPGPLHRSEFTTALQRAAPAYMWLVFSTCKGAQAV
jgi:hypothetical protein